MSEEASSGFSFATAAAAAVAGDVGLKRVVTADVTLGRCDELRPKDRQTDRRMSATERQTCGRRDRRRNAPSTRTRTDNLKANDLKPALSNATLQLPSVRRGRKGPRAVRRRLCRRRLEMTAASAHGCRDAGAIDPGASGV